MTRYVIQLTLLSLWALATGCRQERGGLDNQQDNSQAAAVNLSIDGLPIDATTSRAVVEDVVDFTKYGFTLAGYYTQGNIPVLPADLGTSGLFDDNVATAVPNVFNYQGVGLPLDGPAVIIPVLTGGKYQVTLSKWLLRERSYLSYFAWASSVAAGFGGGLVAGNPITGETNDSKVGAPFISVTSGTTAKSLNVDVVAAKSTDHANNVVRSAIDLNFKHVLTKLKFSVKNNASADMTLTGAKILFASGKVYRTAKYVFDGVLSPLGTWGSYADNEAATYVITPIPTTLVSKANAVPLEELLIIPQALGAGAISVELIYTLPNGASTSTYTRTVPLKAQTFEQNASYTYEISLDETQISINEGRIGAWIATSTGDLPYIAGARDPNVLLLLDGYDAPYTHTDGAQYWLDRSGWNRHCKLVGGVSYDVAGKFYKFSDSPVEASYLDVPKTFPTTTGVTMETIVRTTRPVGEGGSQNVLKFMGSGNGDDRIMFTHFGYNGSETYYFDAGRNLDGNLNRITASLPQSLYRGVAMYLFSKGPSAQYVRRNLLYVNNTLYSGTHRAVNLADAATARIGMAFKGEMKYFKISATAKTAIDGTEYAALSKRHKVPEDTYIQDGLLVDLRGTDPLVGGVWTNRAATGSKYNATMQGNKSLITYNAAGKYYQIGTVGNGAPNGGPAHFLIDPTVAGLSSLETFTIEMVFKSHLGAHDCLMIQTANDNSGRGIFYSSYYSDGKIRFQAPSSYITGGGMNTNEMEFCKPPATAPIKENPIGTTQIRSNVLVRSFGTTLSDTYLRIYVDNAQITERKDIYPEFPVGRPQTIKIGQGGIQISAFRIYNRILPDLERTWNYQVDKAKYNIP